MWISPLAFFPLCSCDGSGGRYWQTIKTGSSPLSLHIIGKKTPTYLLCVPCVGLLCVSLDLRVSVSKLNELFRSRVLKNAYSAIVSIRQYAVVRWECTGTYVGGLPHSPELLETISHVWKNRVKPSYNSNGVNRARFIVRLFLRLKT